MLDTATIAPEIRRLRRHEYDLLVEQGLLDDERVELLDGFIVNMSPQGPTHASVIANMTELLIDALRAFGQLRVQLPLAVSDDSEPEPDFALVLRDEDRRGHPTFALLVVEVAATSQRVDHGKGRLYARAAIPEFWIVNVADRVVEVFTHPDPDAGVYRTLDLRTIGDVVTPAGFPNAEIPVRAMFGGAR